MKFRYRLERININGLKEYSVQYFLCDELLIGRGASCPVHLPFRSVDIQHAKLITNADGSISIVDLSAKRGIKVNGRRVKKAPLKADDKVQIGEILLLVFFDGTYWGFRETRSDAIKTTSDEILKSSLARLNLSRFYPSATSLSLLAMALVVLFFFSGPARGKDMGLWSSGPISNVHHLIGNSCESCHKLPFEPVRDAECKSCHQLSEHAEGLSASLHEHPQLAKRCAECHVEHKGGKRPIEPSSRLCTECHADLSKVSAKSERPKVESFERHPEFRVSTVQFLSDEQRTVLRSELNGAVKDTTRLAFGHKLHLESGLRGLPKGKDSLVCADCHMTEPTQREMMPITFEKQCASCHPLTFDERLPDKQVPHGDSTAVYNFIYAEYAKLFLVKEQQNERMAKVRRIKPGVTVIDEPDIQFTREFVEGESRNAEREIFTRTGCKVCHQIAERSGAAGEAAFAVLPPYMPIRWFSAAQFSHGAHESTDCAVCHSQAAKSERTEDLLLPKIETCKSCHTGVGHPSKVSSPCISCHSFHDPLHLTEGQRQTVSALLLGR